MLPLVRDGQLKGVAVTGARRLEAAPSIPTVSEDGVAFARTFYNDAVTVMEDRRRQFPGALLARLVTLPTMARFEGDLPDARPANVDLTGP